MASRTEPQSGSKSGEGAPTSTASAQVEPARAASWFQELKRRRVFRALVGYGIAAFAVLQVIEPIMHGAHWPEIVLSYVVAALAAGFPVVITLAWIFDVKAGRIARTAPAAAPSQRGIRLALLLAGIGVLAAAPGLTWYFLLRGDTRIVARRDGAGAGAAERKSIAVLPFVNMSADKENEYFSDGITEELINKLSNVDGLQVASRTASFAFKGKDADIRQIGEKLNVSTLLEGSVRRENGRLRISAQLIKVADGYHIWSTTYERELKSIFAVEDELARSIVQALTPKLVGSMPTPLVKPSTESLEAHDLYLQGRYFKEKRSAEALRAAAEFFEQATAKDPSYALAWVGLADVAALLSEYGPVPAASVLPKARQSVQRALELDPRLAEAHATLGLIGIYTFQWKEAEQACRKAIELNPKYPSAHHWLALTLIYQGRVHEAYTETDRAYRLDPTAPILNNLVAVIRAYGGDLDGAVEAFKKTFEIAPTFGSSHAFLGMTYAAQGKYSEAFAEYDRAVYGTEKLFRGVTFVLAGRQAEAQRVVKELEQRATREYVSPAARGLIWVALGERQRGYGLLAKACEELDAALRDAKVNPLYEKFRAEPQFHEVLKCVHLE